VQGEGPPGPGCRAPGPQRAAAAGGTILAFLQAL
jgi:hypothetical protein